MTERVLSKGYKRENGILERVQGVTLRDKVGSCEIHKDLNVKPLRCKATLVKPSD